MYEDAFTYDIYLLQKVIHNDNKSQSSSFHLHNVSSPIPIEIHSSVTIIYHETSYNSDDSAWWDVVTTG